MKEISQNFYVTCFPPFITEEIVKILQKVHTKQSFGLSGISTIVLKNCASELNQILNGQLQICYISEIIPDCSKINDSSQCSLR